MAESHSPAPPARGVSNKEVSPDEAGLRLDRWFRRHHAGLTHGRLEKLLRTGQVRVEGKRAKAGQRLEPGQIIRVPPLGLADKPKGKANRAPEIPKYEAEALRRSVLSRDDSILALNKPAGLAVQGGTGTHRHLDGMLDALRFGAPDRPRLVHRLDKDTSGVLLLARTAPAAAALAKAFRGHEVKKLYWAVCVGVPHPLAGRIKVPLVKRAGAGGERMIVAGKNEKGARPASTDYRVVEPVGSRAAWLALAPLTGRTHQLRVHLASIGTPILGDGKYGGKAAFLPGLSGKLHLHARRLIVPGRKFAIDVSAPLPPHMAETFAFFGFDQNSGNAPFDEDF